MSGRQSPQHDEASGPSNPVVSTPTLSSPALSTNSTPLDTILAMLNTLDDKFSGQQRTLQRLDGRLDTVVGGMVAVRERMDAMEQWLPGVDDNTESVGAAAAASPAETDPATVRHHTSSTPAVATSSLVPGRDQPPHLVPGIHQPNTSQSATPARAESVNDASERDGSDRAATVTSRPPRPEKAATRSNTPHEFKPPQVQAYRALSPKEKAAIQRLSDLLGGTVRNLLDGDVAVDALLHNSGDGSIEQHPALPSSPSSGPVQPIPPTTPPDSPIHSRTLICRQEFLGTFDGAASEVESFISQIRDVWRSNRQPEWESAVVRALPMALKGDAAAWHQGLEDVDSDALTTVDRWIETLRESFPVNVLRLRDEAHNRVWRPPLESASGYYHHKLRLLRQAWGYGQSEERLVSDIRSGFPATFRVMLRLPQQGSTLKALRLRIAEYEPDWEEMYPTSKHPPVASATSASKTSPSKSAVTPSGTTTATARSASAPAAPAAAHSSPSPSTGAFGLAATYDPSRITPAANGKKRIYRRPDNNEPMELNRPCGRCGQDHFNFEHYHLNAPQVRMLEIWPGDDEYPVVEEEVVGAAGDPADFL